ncbi:AzlD family protein [Rhizobium paknamense]|uniref:Membrane protein n=1 Tax=Rhizobium paknamense TaxID=1206817 RepID=A0ABU0IAY0_9HYPH|nr:AzlD family protein [Rhizobium paknamense]MDQ0454823.1 putative membrane protein [Rhizobium paknamense]
MTLDPHMVMIILAAAIATYLTRAGGYLVISRIRSLPPRAEAALNAVPAAVLTTLVAPAFFMGGMDVKIAMLIGLAAGLRFSIIPMLLMGWGAAIVIRHAPF